MLTNIEIQNFWKEVLSLPYQSNTQDNPLHENQVKELLVKYGVLFIHQPNGSQRAPDFKVFFNNKSIVDIECKSSKQVYPTYNGGLPKEDTIYIFTSSKYNSTTIFFGKDVVNKTKRKLYSNLVQDLNSILKNYRNKEEWKTDVRGFDFYVRNMYTQSGKGKIDYFKHAERIKCEQSILNYDWGV